MLWKIIERIWKEEKVPQDWKGFQVKLPKKSEQGECENHREIMLLSVPGKVFNRMLERLKTTVDKKPRDHQTGFRKERSCIDQITTLRIIITEQLLEWNASLYVTFVDFEKAFDNLDRKSLWKLMRHYGIPEKFVTIIKNTYDGTSCRVLHEGTLSDKFEVKTGVRKGCLLSPFMFLLAVDWIMRESTKGRRNGIQWTLWNQLDDLDFADDIALLVHKYTQMQDKTNQMENSAAKFGLPVSKRKTKSMRINTTNDSPIMLDKGAVEDVSSFKYLGSIVNTNGGTDEDVKERIGKARTAFNTLHKIWKSRDITTSTKLRIFNTNVKIVSLYGSETWRISKTTLSKVQTFMLLLSDLMASLRRRADAQNVSTSLLPYGGITYLINSFDYPNLL